VALPLGDEGLALVAAPVGSEQHSRQYPSGSGVRRCERKGTMTADTTLERQAAIAERRATYEADVAYALLNESDAERDERVELVRIAQAMILHALQLDDEPMEN